MMPLKYAAVTHTTTLEHEVPAVCHLANAHLVSPHIKVSSVIHAPSPQ